MFTYLDTLLYSRIHLQCLNDLLNFLFLQQWMIPQTLILKLSSHQGAQLNSIELTLWYINYFIFLNTYLCMYVFIYLLDIHLILSINLCPGQYFRETRLVLIILQLLLSVTLTTFHHWYILYVVREQLWKLLQIVMRFLSGFWTTKPKYSQTQTWRWKVGTNFYTRSTLCLYGGGMVI